jgi:hypothetical protein
MLLHLNLRLQSRKVLRKDRHLEVLLPKTEMQMVLTLRRCVLNLFFVFICFFSMKNLLVSNGTPLFLCYCRRWEHLLNESLQKNLQRYKNKATFFFLFFELNLLFVNMDFHLWMTFVLINLLMLVLLVSFNYFIKEYKRIEIKFLNMPLGLFASGYPLPPLSTKCLSYQHLSNSDLTRVVKSLIGVFLTYQHLDLQKQLRNNY